MLGEKTLGPGASTPNGSVCVIVGEECAQIGDLRAFVVTPRCHERCTVAVSMKLLGSFSLSLSLAALSACSDAAAPIDSSPSDASVAPPDVSTPTPTKDASTPSDGLDAAVAPLDPLDAPGIFVAAGSRMRHVRSLDDGVTWVDDATIFSPTDQGDLYGVRNVIWGNGVFVAFAAKVFTSPEGKTWTEVPKADGQWLASMLYAQSEYVSSGGYGWLATTTTDLGTWTHHPPHAGYTAAHHSRKALAYGKVNGQDAYVVVDDLGGIFRATDGKTWQPVTGAPVVPAGNTWGTQFVYGGGVFVGLLPSGTAMIRSTDGGTTWSSNAALPSAVSSVVFAQGHFTAIGAGHVFTSTDGASWIDHSAATAKAGDVTYGHGVYLALSGGNILRSPDGLAWTQSFSKGTNPDVLAAITFASQ